MSALGWMSGSTTSRMRSLQGREYQPNAKSEKMGLLLQESMYD